MTREEEILSRLRVAHGIVTNDGLYGVAETMHNALTLMRELLERQRQARDLLDNLDADPVAMLRMSASKDKPIDTPAAAVKSVVRQMRAVLGTKEPS